MSLPSILDDPTVAAAIEHNLKCGACAVLSGSEPGSAAQKFREDMLRERAASGGGDERRKELLGRLMSVHAAFKEKRPLSKVYHRPELIESERTRVKEWFRTRFDALDATESGEAAE